MTNLEVRIWYNYHDKNIINEIDESLSIKEQAKQAHFLRNKYRTEARKLMKDRELAENLNTNNSNKPFEYYETKYMEQGYSSTILYKKIIEASTRSNKFINKQFGLA
ncbi:hypothetical protein UT300005_03270 [Clostridium sp. CTA-5]